MMRARLRGEEGSTAIELAFVAPIFLLLLSLVYAYARVAQVNGTLEAATRDAARVASQARSVDEADDLIRQTVLSNLSQSAQKCRDTMESGVVGVFKAGYPVKVTVRCQYDLNDLGLPGVPGTITVSASFTSPVDPNRGVEEGQGPAQLAAAP